MRPCSKSTRNMLSGLEPAFFLDDALGIDRLSTPTSDAMMHPVVVR